MGNRRIVRSCLATFAVAAAVCVAAAQPPGGPRFGPQGPGGPQGPRFGPEAPDPGPAFVNMYRCSKCRHEFSSPTKPSRCPSCNTLFTFVTDANGTKTVSPERNTRNTYVLGAICGLVALAAVGGGIFALVKIIGAVSKPKTRRRVRRPVVRDEIDDDDEEEDDRPRRRARDDRDEYDDDRPRRRRRDS